MEPGSLSDLFNMADTTSGDPYNQKGKTGTSSGGSGITVERSETNLVGRPKPVYDSRLFRYNRVDARARMKGWQVDKDDRMPVEQARQKMDDLLEAAGLTKANSEYAEAFVDALCFAHVINSGSVLQPARGEINIEGCHPFPFIKVLEILGADYRRFFRTYANEVRRVNFKILDGAKEVDDVVAREKYQWLTQVAFERGLNRFPHLAHDSSDACWELTQEERAAIATAKYFAIDGKPNAADLPRADSKPKSVGVSVYEAASKYAGGLAP